VAVSAGETLYKDPGSGGRPTTPIHRGHCPARLQSANGMTCRLDPGCSRSYGQIRAEKYSGRIPPRIPPRLHPDAPEPIFNPVNQDWILLHAGGDHESLVA